MGRNLFREPFDDGTLIKLKVFEDYFKEWLPVFIAKPDPIWKEVKIFDLFAGEGKDSIGIDGSPVRVLKELNQNRQTIIDSGLKISVVINEFDKKKYALLKATLEEIWDKGAYGLEVLNKDFASVFESNYNAMKKSANFLFLDQNGIKEITQSVFKKLIDLKQTDFLFFISSSYVKRFAEMEEFKKYLSITKQDIEGKSYYHIHRIVLDYYRSLITGRYFLSPFSIKKPSGIYGLIFGTNHTYGMEKFLKVCWKHDKLTGEANFDIDNEKIDLLKPTLFEQYNVPSKRQLFEKRLTERILAKSLGTDYDVYVWTLDEGFLPKDANDVLRTLKNQGKIDFSFKMVSSKIHKISEPQRINTH